MKKSIILLAAAAALVTVSCSKAGDVEMSDDAVIGVAPLLRLGSSSKAVVEGVKLPTYENLQVFGYFNSFAEAGSPVGADFTVPYINNKPFACDITGVWRGAGKTYYWPKTGSIVFAGYHGVADVEYAPSETQVMKINDYNTVAAHVVRPADYTYLPDQQLVKEVSETYSSSSIIDPEVSYVTLAHSSIADLVEYYTKKGDNPSAFEDMMYFPVTPTSYNKTNGSNGVPVVLYHALSWISFQAITNETADGMFRIDSVYVNNVLRDGDAVITGTQNSHTCVWTPKAPERTLIQFTGTGSETPSEKDNFVIRYNDGNAQPFGLDFVIVPQPATTLTIYYSQLTEGNGDGAWVKMAPATIELAKLVEVGTQIKIENWEPAKHYTYLISITLDETDEIKIAPSVAPWQNVVLEPVNI